MLPATPRQGLGSRTAVRAEDILASAAAFTALQADATSRRCQQIVTNVNGSSFLVPMHISDPVAVAGSLRRVGLQAHAARPSAGMAAAFAPVAATTTTVAPHHAACGTQPAAPSTTAAPAKLLRQFGDCKVAYIKTGSLNKRQHSQSHHDGACGSHTPFDRGPAVLSNTPAAGMIVISDSDVDMMCADEEQQLGQQLAAEVKPETIAITKQEPGHQEQQQLQQQSGQRLFRPAADESELELTAAALTADVKDTTADHQAATPWPARGQQALHQTTSAAPAAVKAESTAAVAAAAGNLLPSMATVAAVATAAVRQPAAAAAVPETKSAAL